MTSATRALAASSLLLCAMACAAIALLTIASSATEELAQQSHSPVSSVSSLEARVEADAKSAAVKDAGAQSLQAQLIKDAQAAQGQPAAKQHSGEQLKRADAVQESLSKIAQHRAKDVDVAGTLVQRVKADDAKVQGAMSALHDALLPPAVHLAPPKVVVNPKIVSRSVADLTKIALQLHLKQLEAKQRALHPQPSQPQEFAQSQPLAIHAPGQHMPRAVAEIESAAAAVPLPHTKAVASPADSADAILHLAIANVAKQAMKQQQQQQQPHAQLPSAAATEHAVADVAPLPSSPSAAASAILKAALSSAEHNQPATPKTGLSVPFAPLKMRPAVVGIDSHALALAIANAAKYESKLKADSMEIATQAAAAAASSAHKSIAGYHVRRGEIEKALNRAVAFENQMQQMIVDEKAEAEKQQQLRPKSAAAIDKLAPLAQEEKSDQVAAISSALQQAKRRAAGYALSLKTLDQQHKDLSAQRAAASAEAALKRQEEAVANAVAAATAAKAAALRADKAQASVPHAPHAPIMPQAVSSHHAPSWHLADVETPMSHLKAAEAAATAARAAVVAAEAAAAEKTKAVVSAEQRLVQADHAAEEAQAAAASSLAKEYEKKLLSGAKAKAMAGKVTGKGVAVEKAKAVHKESEMQAAEEALQNILKRQARPPNV